MLRLLGAGAACFLETQLLQEKLRRTKTGEPGLHHVQTDEGGEPEPGEASQVNLAGEMGQA